MLKQGFHSRDDGAEPDADQRHVGERNYQV